MSRVMRTTVLRAWYTGLLLLCLLSLNAWSASDKTIVDLERGQPEAASRYHRPRAEHRYQYDKTETDLAAPLPPQTPEGQGEVQRAPSPTPPAPTPAKPPRETPLPDGGR